MAKEIAKISRGVCSAIGNLRERNGDGRAFAHLAFERNLTAMRFGKTFGDGKAKTRTMVGGRKVLAGLGETFEHVLAVFRPDAYTRIAHR